MCFRLFLSKIRKSKGNKGYLNVRKPDRTHLSPVLSSSTCDLRVQKSRNINREGRGGPCPVYVPGVSVGGREVDKSTHSVYESGRSLGFTDRF